MQQVKIRMISNSKKQKIQSYFYIIIISYYFNIKIETKFALNFK